MLRGNDREWTKCGIPGRVGISVSLSRVVLVSVLSAHIGT